MGEHIVIVGGGQSAASLALQLRESGFTGALTLITEEAHPPYQRPPLSKKYLSGEWGADRLYLRTDAAWAELGITIRTATRVSAVDAAAKTLEVQGETLAWDKLALATGAVSRPRPPGFAGRSNVFELRTLADVDALRGAFRPGARLAVVGGGFIGLETAAVAVRAGLEVTVIERAPRILERAVGPATSDALRALHRANGVEILENSGIAAIEGDTAITALLLQDGRRLPVDLVLLGIGVLPATTLAEAAGLAVDNGIAVDALGRTSAPGIWACGDCTSFPYGEGRLRLESVQNAIDQAKAVAASMLGAGVPYRPFPWFWSDQYETKLQIAGLVQGFTEVITRPGRSGHAHWYFREGRFIAVEALNDAVAFMTGKKLLEEGIALEAASFADEGFDPRSRLR